MKLDHYLTLYTKINSKWNKELKVRPEIIQPLEENIKGKLLDISLGNDFFKKNFTPKAKATRAKMNKWGNIKLKAFTQ